MSAALTARHLGKRYGSYWALDDATLQIPTGRVAGIIGPNGAGKSTLLQTAVGLTRPDTGSIELFGEEVVPSAAQLARVAFVPQSQSLYPWFSVGDHLRLGAEMNPSWDPELAEKQLERIGLRRSQRAGRLSGGQQAQLALALAIAKRAELLLLDEPVANLDPLARRELLQALMEYAAEHSATIALSSHLIADVERVCDYVVLIAGGRVRLAGDVEELLETHRRLSGPRRDISSLPGNQTVIEELHTDRQTTLLVRTEDPILDPSWSVDEVSLEDLALAYMRTTRAAAAERAA